MKQSIILCKLTFIIIALIPFLYKSTAQNVNYFPLAEGNGWTYKSNIGSNLIKVLVTEETTLNGIKSFIYQEESIKVENGEVVDRDTLVNQNGFRIFPCSGVIAQASLSASIPLVPINSLDLNQDTIFYTAEELGNVRNWFLTIEYFGDLVADNEIYENCYRIKSHPYFEEDNSSYAYLDYIYAPNIGIVGRNYFEDEGYPLYSLQERNLSEESIETPYTEPVTALHIHQLNEPLNLTNLPSPNPIFLKPDTLKIIKSSSPNQTFEICADGSRASIFEFHLPDGNYYLADLEISILENEDNDINLFGEFQERERVGSNGLRVKYLHPNHVEFEDELKEKVYTINISLETNDNCIDANFSLKIHPAPILMVHGFWDSKEAFKQLESYLIENKNYKDSLLHRVNYDLNNFLSNTNYNSESLFDCIDELRIIRKGIDELIKIAVKDNSISTGKVDMICHSSGGLLARFYLKDTYYRDDIHKIITCNTPHYGTQLANLILDESDLKIHSFTDILCRYFPDYTGYCYDGIIDDMQIWKNDESNTINNLLEHNQVPFHFIGTATKLPLVQKNPLDIFVEIFGNPIGIVIGAKEKILMVMVLAVLVAADENRNGFIDIDLHNQALTLYHELSDGYVPLTSQIAETKNYFDREYISVISALNGVDASLLHINSMDNQLVRIKVAEILGKNSEGDFFKKEKFVKPNPELVYDFTNNIKNNKTEEKSNSEINITPSDTSIVNGGDTLNLTISASDDIKKLNISYIFENRPIIEMFDTNHVNYKLNIPKFPLGINKISVLGLDENGNWVAAAKKEYFISTNELPNSITVDAKTLRLEKDSYKKIKAIGKFNGYEADLTKLKEVKYIFKKGFASHIGEGHIKGDEVGKDTLIIKYKGISSLPIPVEIREPYKNINSSTNTNKYTDDKFCKIKLFPNPTNDLLNIEIENQERTEVLISILDMNGRKILEKHTIISPNKNIEQIETANLPSGIYFISVGSKQGVQTSKFIKS